MLPALLRLIVDLVLEDVVVGELDVLVVPGREPGLVDEERPEDGLAGQFTLEGMDDGFAVLQERLGRLAQLGEAVVDAAELGCLLLARVVQGLGGSSDGHGHGQNQADAHGGWAGLHSVRLKEQRKE